FSFVVEGDQLHLTALDSPLGVDLGDRELDAAVAGGAERCFGAGHRADFTDLDDACISGTHVSAALLLLLATDGEGEHADEEFRGHAMHGRLRADGKSEPA